jgi:hypothetical protein
MCIELWGGGGGGGGGGGEGEGEGDGDQEGKAIFMIFEKMKRVHTNICVRNKYKLLLYNL